MSGRIPDAKPPQPASPSAWAVFWVVLFMTAAVGVTGVYLERRFQELERFAAAAGEERLNAAMNTVEAMRDEMAARIAPIESFNAETRSALLRLEEQFNQFRNETARAAEAVRAAEEESRARMEEIAGSGFSRLERAANRGERGLNDLAGGMFERLGQIELQLAGLGNRLTGLEDQSARNAEKLAALHAKTRGAVESASASLRRTVNDSARNLWTSVASIGKRLDLATDELGAVRSETGAIAEPLSRQLALLEAGMEAGFHDVNLRVEEAKAIRGASPAAYGPDSPEVYFRSLRGTLDEMGREIERMRERLDLQAAFLEETSAQWRGEMTELRHELAGRVEELSKDR